MTDATPLRVSQARALVRVETLFEKWPHAVQQQMVQYLVTRYGLPAMGPIDVNSLRDIAEEILVTQEAVAAADAGTDARDELRREQTRERVRRFRRRDVTPDVTLGNADSNAEQGVTGVTSSTPPGVSSTSELQNGSEGKALRTKSKSPKDRSRSLPGFEQFWTLYPRKVGKGAARNSWEKQDLESKTDAIVKAIHALLPSLRGTETKYIPHPATWLNEQRWDDEPPAPSLFTSKTSGNAQAAGAFIARMTAEKAERETRREPR